MKLAALVMLLLVAGAAPATAGDACADPRQLRGICDLVYTKRDAPDASPHSYLYEIKIHAAACAKDGDPPQLARAKIQRMWRKLEDPHLKCDAASFDVPRGSLLEYAVALRNWSC